MQQALDIVMRILHIGSAIALLGGTIFFLVVMFPVMRTIDEAQRGPLMQLARKRILRITHPAITLLLITGFYNYLANMDLYKQAPKAIHGLIGAKIILALAITTIVFAQSLGVLKGCPSKWAKLNVAMGIAIVILAAVARSLRMGVAGG